MERSLKQGKHLRWREIMAFICRWQECWGCGPWGWGLRAWQIAIAWSIVTPLLFLLQDARCACFELSWHTHLKKSNFGLFTGLVRYLLRIDCLNLWISCRNSCNHGTAWFGSLCLPTRIHTRIMSHKCLSPTTSNTAPMHAVSTEIAGMLRTWPQITSS